MEKISTKEALTRAITLLLEVEKANHPSWEDGGFPARLERFLHETEIEDIAPEPPGEEKQTDIRWHDYVVAGVRGAMANPNLVGVETAGRGIVLLADQLLEEAKKREA